jgi:AhpD family alkylhydroperoxidase
MRHSLKETVMPSRLNPFTAAPEAMNALVALEEATHRTSISSSLRHLIKLRASQMNGCGYCVHMHAREARQEGEDEARLHMLAVWRESSLFTERERAALLWTETLTRIDRSGAPAGDYNEVRKHFDDRGLAELSLLIGVINVWNRIAVGFRSEHPSVWKAV